MRKVDRGQIPHYICFPMDAKAFVTPLRILSYVVIAAMAIALIYAAYISLANWSGIAV